MSASPASSGPRITRSWLGSCWPSPSICTATSKPLVERVAEAGLHRAADPEIEGEDEEPGPGGLGDRPGPVVGAVVHDDDLEARIRCSDLLDHSPDRGGLVERRDDRDPPSSAASGRPQSRREHCMEVGCGARLLQLKLHNFPPKRAYLPRLRLSLPVHGRRRRALVSSARRASRRRGIRGHVPDPPAVGRGRRAEHPGRPHRDGRATAPSSTSTAGGGSGRPFASGSVSCAISSAREVATTSSIRARRRSSPCSAPGLARRRGRYRLLVDWIEVWTLAYWRSYLGGLKGTIAWAIQRLATRVGERAFCFSRLHERRLRDEGFRGPVDVIGVYTGPLDRPEPEPAEPLVVFAGRHIPEKGVLALPPALARARETVPELRAEILGDGPLRAEVERLVGGSRAERRRRGAGLRRRRSMFATRSAAACASRFRPRARATASSWSRRRPRESRASSWRARTTPRWSSSRTASTASSPARPSRTSWRRRSSACTRPGLPCAPRPPTGSRENARTALAGELARDGDATPTDGAEVHVAYNLLHLVPGETGGAEVYARRLLPALREAGSRPRDDAVPRRGRRRARTGAKASTSSRFGSIPGAESAACSRSRRSCHAPFEPRRRICCTTSSTRRRVLPQIPQVTTIHDVDLQAPSRERVAGARRRGRRPARGAPLDSDPDRIGGVEERHRPLPRRSCRADRRRAERARASRRTPSAPPPAEVRRSFGIGDSPLVLSVLAKRPHKNAARLIEAFAQVPEGVLVIPGYPTGYERRARRTDRGARARRPRAAPGLGRRRNARRALPGSRLLRLSVARGGLRPPGARGDAPRRARGVLERHVASRGRRRRGAPLRPARRRGDRRLRSADPRGPASSRSVSAPPASSGRSGSAGRRPPSRTLACYRKALGAMSRFGIDARAAAEEPAGRGRVGARAPPRARRTRRRPRLRAVRADCMGRGCWTSASAGGSIERAGSDLAPASRPRGIRRLTTPSSRRTAI